MQWRYRTARFALLSALGMLGGAECQPRTPAPALVDGNGAVDISSFGALVAATEETRGLDFVRRPELVLLDADDSELASLRDNAALLAPIRPVSREPGSVEATAWADRAHARVVALRPPDPAAVRQALGFLIDAQQFPQLADLAPVLPGDPGVALRALLEASARATASGRWFTRAERSEELEPLATLPERIANPDEFPPLTLDGAEIAPILLLHLDDPNLAFRKPPLSTRQLLSPAAYRSSKRPLLLDGTPPGTPGCSVSQDESFGVLQLLQEAARRGLAPGDESIAAWKGDRLMRFACADGRSPWLYVIELEQETDAGAFVGRADASLPATLPRPLSSAVLGRRVIVWNGLEDAQVLAFGHHLESREIAELELFVR